MMNDELRALAQSDRDVTEASALGAQVAAFYTQLMEGLVPEQTASSMVHQFSFHLLNRHFGCDLSALAELNAYLYGEED